MYEVQLDEDRASAAQEVFTKYLSKDVSVISYYKINIHILHKELYIDNI